MVSDNMRFEFAHYNSMDFGSYGLGASISPQGPQIMTTNTAINWGLSNLEISLPAQMSFQQQGHLAQLGNMERDEVIRLAKLNRVNLSVHAPIIDPAGCVGGGFSEEARIHALRDFEKTIDFADQIGTKNGMEHVPIVLHSTEQARGNPMPKEVMYVVNQESRQIEMLQKKSVAYSEEFFKRHNMQVGVDYESDPQHKGHYIFLPEGQLKYKGIEMLRSLNEQKAMAGYWKEAHEERLLQHAEQFNVHFDELKKHPEQFEKRIGEANYQKLVGELKRYETYAEQERRTMEEMKHLENKYKVGGELKMTVPTDDYASQKFTETIAQVATYAYEKPSKPMICVENFYPELALSNPAQLTKAIDEARKLFATKLVREKGMSHDEAAGAAVEMIGMTFDVGHANLFKKYVNPLSGKNYTDDDIKDWLSKAYPYLKHVHITDNLGDYDAHLPVGWGTAPINDMMKMLKERGFSGRAILETFGPVNYGGQAIGVPMSLYGMGTPLGGSGVPTWEHATGSYFDAGYAFMVGPIYPDVSVQQYGIGFSGLPYAAGAQLGGGAPQQGQSQFSGAPMS